MKSRYHGRISRTWPLHAIPSYKSHTSGPRRSIAYNGQVREMSPCSRDCILRHVYTANSNRTDTAPQLPYRPVTRLKTPKNRSFIRYYEAAERYRGAHDDLLAIINIVPLHTPYGPPHTPPTELLNPTLIR